MSTSMRLGSRGLHKLRRANEQELQAMQARLAEMEEEKKQVGKLHTKKGWS